MHRRSDAPADPSHSRTPASPPPNPRRLRIARLADSFLRMQPIWVTLASLFVCVSNIVNLDAAYLWVGLAVASAPFPLRVARSGITSLRTPFDLPIALMIAGAAVGFCVSDDRGISLGALQCIIAITLFYYSWVNFAAVSRILKGLMISLAVVFLIASVLYVIVVSIVDGRPNLDLLGSGTHHGFAMYLTIEGAILLGVAAFDGNKRTRLLCLALFLVFVLMVLAWTRDSLHSLFDGVSVSGRWDTWQETADLLGESPMTGLGLGCWALTYWGTTVLGTVGPGGVNGITHAHNAYLELYSNAGIVGALAVLAAIGMGIKVSLDIIRSPRSGSWYGFGVGVILACVAMLVVAMVESAPMGVPLVRGDTYRYVVSPAVWMLFGLLVTSHRHATASRDTLHSDDGRCSTGSVPYG